MVPALSVPQALAHTSGSLLALAWPQQWQNGAVLAKCPRCPPSGTPSVSPTASARFSFPQGLFPLSGFPSKVFSGAAPQAHMLVKPMATSLARGPPGSLPLLPSRTPSAMSESYLKRDRCLRLPYPVWMEPTE